jgi:phosphate-selective porin OprO/OprP
MMLKSKLMVGAAVILGSITMTAAALAATSPAHNAARLEQLERELQELRRQIETQQSQEERLKKLEEEQAKMPKIDGKKLKVESRDGAFSMELGGRIMADAHWADDDITPIGSGGQFRRVRLGMQGKMFTNWGYKAEIDISKAGSTGVSLVDAYISYNGFSGTSIQVGRFKEPFSLEEMTSSNHITFMERSLPVEAFSPSRNYGVGVFHGGDNYSASAGVFLNGEGAFGATGLDEAWSTTGRLTWAPINNGNKVIHLGVSGSYRGHKETRSIRFRARPELNNAPRLVDTGSCSGFVCTSSTLLGLEGAAVWGPFSLQGEYMRTDVKTVSPLPNFDLDGWYVFGSWFVTGEQRAYSGSSGTFGRPRATDAVELGVRYSSLDLDFGGQMNNWTFGAKYYFNPNIRLSGNYVHSRTKDGVAGIGTREKANIFQVRFHIDY